MRPTYPRLKLSNAAGINNIGDGNSMMFGVGSSTAAKKWPAQMLLLAPWAGTGGQFNNRSQGGRSISTNAGAGTMMATAPTNIDPLLDPTKQNNLWIHEFINDLKGNGNDRQKSLDAFAAYTAARRAAAAAVGAKLFVIALTTTPAGAAPVGEGQSWVDARMAAIADCNAALRANPRRYCDLLIDIAMYSPFREMYEANVWTPAAFQARGLWQMSDGSTDDYTHFGDAGYARMAAIAAANSNRIRRVA